MPRKETITNVSTAQAQQEAASDGIDAYELPKSLVTRLARSAVSMYALFVFSSVLVSFSLCFVKWFEEIRG